MKKIISWITLVAIFLTFAVSSAEIFKNPTKKNKAVSDDGCVAIQVTPKNKEAISGKAYPVNGTITITISTEDDIDGSLIVYYTTVDHSAIYSVGDYIKEEGTVTLNNSNKSANVFIDVSTTTFASSLEGLRYTREFTFNIVGTEYAKGTCTVDNEEITCMIDSSHVLNVAQGSDNSYIYRAYEYSSAYQCSSRKEVSAFDVKSFGSWFGGSSQYSWIEDYVNTGLANVYAGFRTDNIKNGICISVGDVTYTLYGTNTNKKITQLYYDYSRLWHTSTSYWKQVTGNHDSDLKVYNYGNEEFTTYLSDGQFYRGLKITDNTVNTNSVNDLALSYTVDNDDAGVVYSVVGTVIMDEVLIDNIAPTFVDAYFDGDHAYVDGKVRVALRYSEPVHLMTSNAYAKVGFGSYYFYFPYESGNFSDTLVFSMDLKAMSKNVSTTIAYSAGKFFGVYEGSSDSDPSAIVGDLGAVYKSDNKIPTNNLADPKVESTIKNFHLDFNNPEIKKTQDDYSGAVSSRNVQITVKNCTNGDLYYVWSTKKDLDISYSYGMSNYEGFLAQFDFKKAVYNTTSSQKFEISSFDKNGIALHGEYYLHTFVESQNGKSYYARYGSTSEKPYVFDSIAPTIGDSAEKGTSNSPKSRTYTIPLVDDGEGVAKIELVYKKAYGETKTLQIWADGDSTSIYDGANLTFTVTPDLIGLGENEYGYFDLGLHVVDKCENDSINEKIIESEFFDTRNLFEVSETSVSGDTPFYTTTLDEKAYLLSDTLTLSYTHSDSDAVTYQIEKLVYGDLVLIENHTAKVSDEVLNSYVTLENVGTNTIKISPKKSGKMSVIFEVDESKYTIEKSYYFTSSYEDKTTNAEAILGREYVKSYVYQLSDDKYYYLVGDLKNGIHQVNYGDSSSPLIFSDYETAKNYVEFMEKQDLSLLLLTPDSTQIITYLNHGGSTEYVKADGETKTAKANQYWIRYKAESWSYTNQKWVYYYYGEGVSYQTINFTLIPTSLSNAISNVSDSITGLGSYTYLVSEDYQNAYGQLTVNQSQIIDKYIEVNETKSGSIYTTSLSFFGDKDIYCSEYYPYTYVDGNIKFDESVKNIKYVMQYAIDASSNTRLYYYSVPEGKKFNITEMSSLSSKWKEMENADGSLFDSYFPKNSAGIYAIMELDDSGVRVFLVYIDHLAPELNYEYIASSSSTEWIQGKMDYFLDDKTIGVNKINFKTISNSEGDPYSYISFYKGTYSRSYVGTYMVSDLLQKEVALEDGTYYIVVSDRFGNSYTTKINYNTLNLVVTVTVSEDETYFTISCNRSEDQIYSYEILSGNQIITTTYTANKKIYQSGNYIIKIKDIYGNEYVNKGADGTGFHFQKAQPNVTWRYETDDGYQLYKDDVTGQPMLISQSEDDSIYFISTSKNLQFSIPLGQYNYSFISGNPDVSTSQGTSTLRVNINSTSGWKLKIWYEKYPESYVTYICDIDKQSPDVIASYEINEYIISDADYLDQIAAGYSQEGVEIQSNSYQFKTATYDGYENNNYIRSGDVVQTSKFKVTVSDENKVKEILVYLNDELIEVTFDETNGVFTHEFTGYGKYRIVATDIFGNSTNMQFENKELVSANHYVDDKLVDTLSTYGNESDTLRVNSKSQIIYMVNGTQYLFYVNEKGVYRYVYVTKDLGNESMGWTVEKVADLYLLNDSSYQDDVWYQVKDITDNIYVKHTSEGFFIKVETRHNERTSVNYSVLLDNGSEPIVFKSVLSDEFSDVDLYYNDGSQIVTNHDGNMVLIYDEFSIDPTSIDKESINRIRIAYSKTTKFTYYSTIYSSTQELLTYSTSKNGFYAIEITNVYGQVTVYYLHKSDTMTVITTATYSDGTENVYSDDYSQTIYSNNTVTVGVYSKEATFEITRGGYEYKLTPETQGDALVITIKESGKYIVHVKDEYGNTQIRQIEIQKQSLAFKESLIYGYNQDALLLNQGYTNQILSIDFDVVEELKITSIAIESSKGIKYVYDLNSETKINATKESLKNVIGTDGDGTYYVYFRDIYGNKVSKTIQYNETGTLKVEMNYRSSTDYVVVNEFDEIWSNNSVKITTTSIKNQIYIDGNRVECPLTLSFSTYDGSGQKDYEIAYQDEYGFKYTFQVHLLRQEINIKAKDGITTKEIDGVITTKDNIVVSFPEDTVCTYSIDGIGSYEYTSDKEIVQDGLYTFTAVDKAGNKGVYIIEKDTSVEYKFYLPSTEFVLMNGGVANNTVEFKALNKDTAYIYLITKDGKEYARDSSIVRFTETGEYKALLRDEVGNETYFSFIIITHKLSSFEYHVPYNYTITDAWITPSAGYIMSFMENVDAETGFKATTDGYYTITLKSNIDGSVYSFNFTIDSTPPTVELVGVEDGGKTTGDVTFKGACAGDTFYIYKDGKLVKKTTLSSVNDAPTIKTGGVYRVVVENEAGVKVEFTFTRAKILNSAGSSLIYITSGIAMLALLVGLIFRRSKIDK